MITINRLRTLARSVTPIALDVYDRTDPTTILSSIARIRRRPGLNVETTTMEWKAAFPELRRWVGERKTQQVFAGKLTVTFEPYEITLSMDRRDLDGANALWKAADLAEEIGLGFAHGKVWRAYKPLVDNALTYDGQSMFDSAHTHPNGQAFSNLLTVGVDLPARAVATAPTLEEARAELKAAIRALQRNRLVRKTLHAVDTDVSKYVVISRSEEVSSAFYDLLSEEKVGDEINRFRGKFQLLEDPANNDDSYDVIYAAPNGPRPVVFVPTKEPRGLEFDDASRFRDAEIPLGMDGVYGFAPAFPQVVLRVTP